MTFEDANRAMRAMAYVQMTPLQRARARYLDGTTDVECFEREVDEALYRDPGDWTWSDLLAKRVA